MKKSLAAVVLLALLTSLSGCSWELPSPDSLITAPASDKEKIKFKQVIATLLNHDEYLTVPTNMDNPMVYTQLDADQDGEDEIIAFYNKENGFETGFVILESDGSDELRIASKIKASGTSVDYFKMADLDGDGRNELLFGVNVGSIRNLYIYRYDNRRSTELGQAIYETLTLGQVLDDGGKQIITVLRDTTTMSPASTLGVYALTNNVLTDVYRQEFEGYCNEVLYTQVSRERSGLYVTIQHNFQFTTVMLLLYEDGQFTIQMEEVLEHDYASMEGVQLFRDIDNDGVTEVFAIVPPEVGGDLHGYDTYLRVWKRWDGAASLVPVQAALSNQAEGYEFIVPVGWLDTLYYGFVDEGPVEWLIFFYEDSDYELHTLFSIAAIDQYVWDSDDSLRERGSILGNNPNRQKIYVGVITDPLPEGVTVDAASLISCLKIDGGK